MPRIAGAVGLAVAVLLTARPAAAQTTVTLIDTTAADVGRYPSLAIGSDGLGLIAYYDRTNGNLKAAHCSNTACTAATLSVLDSVGDVGSYTSLAIGPDGRGVIAYHDLTNNRVKVAHCNDVACTSASVRVIEPAFTGWIDLAIGSDGLPLIAYVNLFGNVLRTAHCNVANCDSFTLATHGTPEGSQGVAVAVGADGLPLIAVETRMGGVAAVRRCQDVACTSSLGQPPSSGPEIFVQPRAMVVPPDGQPLIGYRYFTIMPTPQIQEVRMSRCADAQCLGQAPVLALTGSAGPDVALQGNGLPWFAYAEVGGRLFLRRCTDATCSGWVETCAPANAVFHVSLVRTSTDRSLVAFHNFTQGANSLGVAYDASTPCRQVEVDDIAVQEAPGAQANFVVRLTQASTQDVTVDYATVSGTAVANQDFAPVSGTVTFPAGIKTRQILVPVFADGIDEPLLESFGMVLSNPSGAVLGDADATGTIVDADPPPRIVAGDCLQTEGDAGAQDCVVPVTLQGASTQAVTVAYATADGSATSGVDYVAATGTLTFAPLATSRTMPVSVLGDTAVELDEGFGLVLSSPVNATILHGLGLGTIFDDDAPSLSSLELTHGGRVRADLAAAAGPAADQDLYRLAQAPWTSWEVVADEVSGDVAPGLVLERLAEDNSTVLQTGTPLGAGPARAMRWQYRESTFEVRHHIRVRSASCTTDCGPDDTYRLRVYETTGLIPRFNNSATQATVLVLQNTTAEPVLAYADFWQAGGTRIWTVAASLAAHGVAVVNTSSVPELAGQSGSVTVTHTAPYGGLAGKTVALEPATGLSFDTPMVFKPR
jgi:hypothetical protein